jgi:hypothetical protein
MILLDAHSSSDVGIDILWLFLRVVVDGCCGLNCCNDCYWYWLEVGPGFQRRPRAALVIPRSTPPPAGEKE